MRDHKFSEEDLAHFDKMWGAGNWGISWNEDLQRYVAAHKDHPVHRG